jgi:outer membrane protein
MAVHVYLSLVLQADVMSASEGKLPMGAFLSLEGALSLAIQVHPAIEEGVANMRASGARTEQARSLYYPQVYANLDSAAGSGRINPRFLIGGGLLQPNLSQYSAGVIASQRLYDFGFTRSLIESNQLAERAQEQDVNARLFLVALNVQRSYLTSLKRKRLVQIAEDTVRERGVIKSQIDALYRQQLKSKLDLNLVQVELTNAESQLVRARNELKASFADLNRAMGIAGRDEYVLEDLSVAVRPQEPLETLINQSLSHPEVQRAKQFSQSAEARARAMKKQNLPTVTALASGGDYETFDNNRNVSTGGWWTAGAMVSMPLFTGFLIENQVREATAQKEAADAGSVNVQQVLVQSVTNAYLETITLAQQIRLYEEQVKTALEALSLARQRYRLGLGSIVEVTQSEVALTGAQTRLAEAQYDYKVAEVSLAYAAGSPVTLEARGSSSGSVP